MYIGPGGIINDFIEPNKNQYVIPVYQRNYEWAESDCRKLFEDIVNAHLYDRNHFCGSIVYTQIKEENKIKYYVVIDGQQRLTTIYLLIKALIDCADKESHKEKLLEAITNTDKFNKYNFDEASKLKLKPIKSDNAQLSLLMDGKFDEVDKRSGIYRNYKLFCELIQGLFEENPDLDVSNIYDGLQHLTCAVIRLQDTDAESPQQIFERINSTGVPLQLADKIRNFVLMTDVDQDRLYEDYWLKSEQLLTKQQLEDFFLDYLNMKLEGFAKRDTAYALFKDLFDTGSYTNESMLQEIYHYVKQYATFYNGNKNLNKKINASLEGLRSLNQSTAYLFLFRVFDDYEEGIIDQKELSRVLDFLLTYSVRRIACEVGSNSLRGLYKTLYSRVFSNAENKEHYYDSLASFMLQLTTKDAVPRDDDFSSALLEKNIYGKKAFCKYVLVAIENQGKEKLITENLTIEHVLPQNKNLSTSWQKMLGDNWLADKERYLHTLGNLTLTGYNSELGDKPFAEKKRLIEENGSHVNILYRDIRSCETWNASAISARAKVLADYALKIFAIESPLHVIEFRDARYSLYTSENASDATYKHVNYYELLGERVIVDTFVGMLRSVVSKLYEIDPTIITSMAQGKKKYPGWGVVPFSYDPEDMRCPVKLSESSGIYMLGAGMSAADCVAFIRACLLEHDLDIEQDFVYSARQTKNVEIDE